MALHRILKVRQGTVWFKSGHFYKFNYTNYENDPDPIIICLSAVKGIHDKTGHRHNYIQAINFTYIPRSQRKEFIKIWLKLMTDYNGHVLLTWRMIQRRWPFMKIAARRYILDAGFIRNMREIPVEDVERVVIGSLRKDFSMKALRAFMKGKRKKIY